MMPFLWVQDDTTKAHLLEFLKSENNQNRALRSEDPKLSGIETEQPVARVYWLHMSHTEIID